MVLPTWLFGTAVEAVVQNFKEVNLKSVLLPPPQSRSYICLFSPCCWTQLETGSEEEHCCPALPLASQGSRWQPCRKPKEPQRDVISAKRKLNLSSEVFFLVHHFIICHLTRSMNWWASFCLLFPGAAITVILWWMEHHKYWNRV